MIDLLWRISEDMGVYRLRFFFRIYLYCSQENENNEQTNNTESNDMGRVCP